MPRTPEQLEALRGRLGIIPSNPAELRRLAGLPPTPTFFDTARFGFSRFLKSQLAVGGDPVSTFGPQPQPVDVTGVAPQAPVVSPEAQEFLRTFSVPQQPTIGQQPTLAQRQAQEPIRQELTGIEPTIGVGLPGLQQAPEPGGFAIKNPESKFFDLSPGEQDRFRKTQAFAIRNAATNEQFQRVLENAGFGDVEDPFIPFGSTASFLTEAARGFSGEAPGAPGRLGIEVPGAGPVSRFGGRLTGEAVKFAGLIGGAQALGVTGVTADILAGLASGTQRQIVGEGEFDPLAPIAEAAEVGSIGGLFRTVGGVVRASRAAKATPTPETVIEDVVAQGIPEAPVLPPKRTAVTEAILSDTEAIALNKAEIKSIREATGLEKLPKPDRKRFGRSLQEAKDARLDESALTTADEVLRPGKARQVTDAEHSGMVLKAAKIQTDLDASIKGVSDLVAAGDEAGARVAQGRSDILLEQLDKLTRASDLAGRETARALSIRRLRIAREDFSVASIARRATAAKGTQLTPQELSKVGQQAGEIKALESKVKDLELNNNRLLAETDQRLADELVSREVLKTEITTRATSSKAKLVAERTNIKKQLTALGFRSNDVTGLGPEAAYLVGRLAINHIKQGATSLGEAVRKTLVDLPGLTPRDVHQAINTRNPKAIQRARTDVTNRVTAIKTEARLLTEIDNIERGIFRAPTQRAPAPAQIRALRSRLTQLRSEVYRSGIDGARLERSVRTINELQDQLANQFRPLRRRPTQITPELQATREKIKTLRRTLKVEDELTDLNQQLATGEFRIPAKPEPRRIAPELERAEIELINARQQVRSSIQDLQPLTTRQKIGEGLNTLRTLKATADMSGVLRQGLVLSVRRPDLAARSFGRAFRATFNKFTSDQIDNGIRSAEHHFIREKSGLFLAESGGGIRSSEESFMSRLAEKAPVIGPIVRASERNMNTFLNLLRVGAFDDFLAKFPNATDTELRAWADWINVATGRGNLGRASAVANELAAVVFAPRFAVSRIQTPGRIFRNLGQPRVRNEIAKDMAALAGIGSTALALADYAGFDVGTSPRESDFGKIRIGNTRIDIWAGMQQPMRLISRLGIAITDKIGLTGQDLAERDREFDPLEALGRFSAYKLAPSVTVPLELFKGETIVGEDVTPSQTAIRSIMPLVYEDILDAYREEGAEQAALVAGLTFFGVGASTFEDSHARTRRDISQLQKEGRWSESFKKKLDWNIKHPDRRIVKVK